MRIPARNSRAYHTSTTVKYDTNGKELWVKRYRGSDPLESYARAIALDKVGNVYVTGYSKPSSKGYDFITLKY